MSAIKRGCCGLTPRIARHGTATHALRFVVHVHFLQGNNLIGADAGVLVHSSDHRGGEERGGEKRPSNQMHNKEYDIPRDHPSTGV